MALQVPDAETATNRLVAGGAVLIARAVETQWRSLNARLTGGAALVAIVALHRSLLLGLASAVVLVSVTRLLGAE